MHTNIILHLKHITVMFFPRNTLTGPNWFGQLYLAIEMHHWLIFANAILLLSKTISQFSTFSHQIFFTKQTASDTYYSTSSSLVCSPSLSLSLPFFSSIWELSLSPFLPCYSHYLLPYYSHLPWVHLSGSSYTCLWSGCGCCKPSNMGVACVPLMLAPMDSSFISPFSVHPICLGLTTQGSNACHG